MPKKKSDNTSINMCSGFEECRSYKANHMYHIYVIYVNEDNNQREYFQVSVYGFGVPFD